MVIDTYASLPLEEKEHLVEEIFSDVSLFISSEVLLWNHFYHACIGGISNLKIRKNLNLFLIQSHVQAIPI